MFIDNREELTTNVVDCYEYNNKVFVILTDTIFYPLSGGQLPDTGMIDDAYVLDVFYHDSNIVHQVSKAVTGEVECKLNIDVRYQHSLIHSAQHLFSAVVESSGVDTTSFAMKDDCFTIDILKIISREELNEFEKEINAKIRKGAKMYSRQYDTTQDQDIDCSYLDVDLEQVRLVIIEGIDKNPCGGTHIENISEIDYFKIVKHKYMGDKTRITALIGDNAIDYVNTYFDHYNEIIKMLNQKEDNIYSYIEQKLKDNKKMQKTIKKLEKQLKNG